MSPTLNAHAERTSADNNSGVTTVRRAILRRGIRSGPDATIIAAVYGKRNTA
jgi:hypothetical protein